MNLEKKEQHFSKLSFGALCCWQLDVRLCCGGEPVAPQLVVFAVLFVAQVQVFGERSDRFLVDLVEQR